MVTLSRLAPYISRLKSRISRIVAQRRESNPLPASPARRLQSVAVAPPPGRLPFLRRPELDCGDTKQYESSGKVLPRIGVRRQRTNCVGGRRKGRRKRLDRLALRQAIDPRRRGSWLSWTTAPCRGTTCVAKLPRSGPGRSWAHGDRRQAAARPAACRPRDVPEERIAGVDPGCLPPLSPSFATGVG
eukprot:SAG31_NODE_4825_length_2924_cov_2.221239_2_plen_187_part_00